MMNKFFVVLPALLACLAMPAFADDAAEVRVSVVDLPQELQDRTVLVSLGSGPSDANAKLVVLNGLNNYSETVSLAPAEYYCTAAVQYDALNDYPLQEADKTTFLQAEAGGQYELTYAVTGDGWYQFATGQQRYYTLLPTESPPQGYEPTTAQIGVYLSVPDGFSQHGIAYLQNLYTGDVYELDLYDSNKMAAVMTEAVSGKYAFLSYRVVGDETGRYCIESEQPILTTEEGADFHLTVTDKEHPDRAIQTPSRSSSNPETVPGAPTEEAEMPSQPVKEEPKRGGILTIVAEAVPLLAAGGCLVWIDRRRRL